MKKFILSAVAAAAVTFISATVAAAPPYVDRRQTLPPVNFAFDMGLGIGHYDYGGRFGNDGTGAGLNFELGVGIIRHLELGFRQGVRFGNEGRLGFADFYGRLYDWKTFDTGGATATNPEALIRGELVDTQIVELSLEGRVVFPFVRNTDLGMMFGVPLAFHLGQIVRLDTGGYVQVLFADGTPNALILPFDAWFQVSDRFWLGPRAGVVVRNPGGNADIPLGFGLGYQFARFGDFKAGFLFPAVDDRRGSANWGIGAGVQLRIE
jgi:hypothetical protein